eukprot:PLAT11857.1.p3 GENE.PLAT11857.1~~PLAT11857.1.p3  ORF type:complete len:317 (+),score=179.80 PLAT11857.1:36-953(+)
MAEGSEAAAAAVAAAVSEEVDAPDVVVTSTEEEVVALVEAERERLAEEDVSEVGMEKKKKARRMSATFLAEGESPEFQAKWLIRNMEDGPAKEAAKAAVERSLAEEEMEREREERDAAAAAVEDAVKAEQELRAASFVAGVEKEKVKKARRMSATLIAEGTSAEFQAKWFAKQAGLVDSVLSKEAEEIARAAVEAEAEEAADAKEPELTEEEKAALIAEDLADQKREKAERRRSWVAARLDSDIEQSRRTIEHEKGRDADRVAGAAKLSSAVIAELSSPDFDGPKVLAVEEEEDGEAAEDGKVEE